MSYAGSLPPSAPTQVARQSRTLKISCLTPFISRGLCRLYEDLDGILQNFYGRVMPASGGADTCSDQE